MLAGQLQRVSATMPRPRRLRGALQGFTEVVEGLAVCAARERRLTLLYVMGCLHERTVAQNIAATTIFRRQLTE